VLRWHCVNRRVWRETHPNLCRAGRLGFVPAGKHFAASEFESVIGAFGPAGSHVSERSQPDRLNRDVGSDNLAGWSQKFTSLKTTSACDPISFQCLAKFAFFERAKKGSPIRRPPRPRPERSQSLRLSARQPNLPPEPQKAGSRPASAGYWRRIRRTRLWILPILAESKFKPLSTPGSRRLSWLSCVPFRGLKLVFYDLRKRVSDSAAASPGRFFSKRYCQNRAQRIATLQQAQVRPTSERVLPEPAPAVTAIAALSLKTASFC